MDWKSASKEVGKGFINLGIAFIVFAFLQPFVKGEFDKGLFFMAFATYIILNVVGAILIAIGGDKDGS